MMHQTYIPAPDGTITLGVLTENAHYQYRNPTVGAQSSATSPKHAATTKTSTRCWPLGCRKWRTEMPNPLRAETLCGSYANLCGTYAGTYAPQDDPKQLRHNTLCEPKQTNAELCDLCEPNVGQMSGLCEPATQHRKNSKSPEAIGKQQDPTFRLPDYATMRT